MNARLLLLSVVLALAPGSGVLADPAPSPAPAASAAPSPPVGVPEDKAVTARAKGELVAWAAGTIDRSHYTQRAADAFSDSVVAQISPQLKPLGELKSLTFISALPYQGDTIYRYMATCANGNLLYTYVIDGTGKIDGIFFKPL